MTLCKCRALIRVTNIRAIFMEPSANCLATDSLSVAPRGYINSQWSCKETISKMIKSNKGVLRQGTNYWCTWFLLTVFEAFYFTIFPFVQRSFAVRSACVRCSFSVRSPFTKRSLSVRSPFTKCSFTVRSLFTKHSLFKIHIIIRNFNEKGLVFIVRKMKKEWIYKSGRKMKYKSAGLLFPQVQHKKNCRGSPVCYNQTRHAEFLNSL
jgi:hypothetical protein